LFQNNVLSKSFFKLIKNNSNTKYNFKLLESFDSEKQVPTVYNCLGFGVIKGIDLEAGVKRYIIKINKNYYFLDFILKKRNFIY
jgi:hypothetical protein